MKKCKIVLIRCPQAFLIGEKTGGVYSPNRSITPEPTLAQLHGIINSTGLPIHVQQIDLRHPKFGKVKRHTYGHLNLPYAKETVLKTYSGVALEEVYDRLSDADVLGFTSDFTMSRRIVADHIAWVRQKFPNKEIWVGGRDLFTERVIDVYTEAGNRKNMVIWHGHVYASLPTYLRWKLTRQGKPFGIDVYSSKGKVTKLPAIPLTKHASKQKVLEIALPIYPDPSMLDYFIGSAEGQPHPSFGRFVHMTLTTGCPNDCGYCTTGYRERFLLQKSLETIEKELKMYRTMGIKTIAIMDDNLLALGWKKVAKIMNLVNSYDFDIEYGNGLQLSLLDKYWDKYVGPIFNNCVSLYAPLEDLTQDRLYNKLHSMNQQLQLMKRIAKEKPGRLKYITMGVIVGVPGHTKELLEGNFMLNLAKFLNIFKGSGLKVGATVFNFITLSGTTFGEEALDSGRMVVDDPISADPEVSNFGTPSYAPISMTHEEVYQIYEQALNLNPAGCKLGITYRKLQQFGERAVPRDERGKIPPHWRVSGYHLRDEM